jgi:hypothetical protein
MQLNIPRKLPALLQSALYAAERMSHAIWISHVIGLVVKGEPSSIVIFFVLTQYLDDVVVVRQ